jgi:phage tail sheath protein FI
VSYPGVYVDEFTPASPIEGVSTSVAAFIGLTQQGPPRVPTRIQSFDDFLTIFGGHAPSDPVRYMPLSVEGFFRNGGTDCVIIRASNAVPAHLDLVDAAGDAVIHVVAKTEGAAGANVKVTVAATSNLKDALNAVGGGNALKAATSPARTITALSAPDRRTLTVAAGQADDFMPDDRVVISKGADKVTAVVARASNDTIALTQGIPGAVDFTGGKVQIDDIAAGDKTVRVKIPANFRLPAAVPAGTLVTIADNTNSEQISVASVTADALTFARPLTNPYDKSAGFGISSLEFTLTVADNAGHTEVFAGLSTGPQHPRYWSSAVASNFVTLTNPPVIPTNGDIRPAVIAATPLGGVVQDDPTTSWNDLLGDPNPYLDLLAARDEVSIVAIPGATTTVAQAAIVAHCEAQYDRVAVLDSIPTDPHTSLPAEVQKVSDQRLTVTGNNLGFAALYYPWIVVNDPVLKQTVAWPPSGHIAGVYAKTDATRGVHKAPANMAIVGAVGLTRRLSDQQQGPLNLDGIDILRILPGQGVPVVWGARTTTTENRNWQYINIRRLFTYLEESIATGIRGSVFEPNDLGLWQRLNRTITDFLTRTWRDGALFGATAKDAFYVRIDEALNPVSTQKLGRLYIEIGVRPVYPAEFIIVRIGIWDGGSSVSES